jgi:tripartite ATP-independent transporter DctM subunit
MDIFTLAFLLLGLLFLLLFFGIWVAVSLFVVAFTGLWLSDISNIHQILATTTWAVASSWSLAALPLFIWMGEILFRSKLSSNLFYGLSPWLKPIPGRLLHINILACSIFAAVSGSSAATTATIGKICYPELKKRNYPNSVILATLAGSGTLGFLIPPSIILIVYGVSAEVSIARLFIAGILPAFLLIAFFMSYTILWALFNKNKIPQEKEKWSLREKLSSVKKLLPIFTLIFCVIAFIYLGWATAVESASIGVAGALFLAFLEGSLNKKTFLESLLGAVQTSTMITFIIAGSAFLSLAMGFTGIPRALAGTITQFQISTFALIAILTVFFVILGFFLDGISIVILTSSVILPVIVASNINLLWFGIYLVLVVEMSQITPPVGFNLFVLQNLSEENLFKIAWYALPFFLLIFLLICVITFFPAIVTWLPTIAFQRG